MIDKKTRKEIGILLLKRLKRLGKPKVNALDLYCDFYWLMNHSGMILEEILGEPKEK